MDDFTKQYSFKLDKWQYNACEKIIIELVRIICTDEPNPESNDRD